MAEDQFLGSSRGVQLRGSRYPGFSSRGLSSTGNIPVAPSTPTAPTVAPAANPPDGSDGLDSDRMPTDPSELNYDLNGRFPNAAALGIDENVSRIVGSVPGPIGAIASGWNSVGNVVNTVKNDEDLTKIGTPLSFGQRLGGFLGMNGYNGTLTSALNAKMSTEDGRGVLSKGPTTDEINSQIAAEQPDFEYEAPQKTGPITREDLGPLEGSSADNSGRDATRDFGGTGNGAERDGNETATSGDGGGGNSSGGGSSNEGNGSASGTGGGSADGGFGSERDGDGSGAGGGSGSSGGSDGNGGNDGSDGGGWRQGGPIGDDGDGQFEPVQAIVHEGEVVIRPEAVQILGADLLDMLNNVATMPQEEIVMVLEQALDHLKSGTPNAPTGDYAAAGSPTAPAGSAPPAQFNPGARPMPQSAVQQQAPVAPSAAGQPRFLPPAQQSTLSQQRFGR